jgi:GNAT superfamily N-acetyltransferase
MTQIVLTPYTPADHDWLVEQHQTLYTLHDGFDDSFGPLVDQILTEFEINFYPDCEAGWIARNGDQRLGSIFCVKLDAQTAKLRMFLLVPDARGKRLGARLLSECMGFAQAKGYRQMTLWTHESHTAACALYAKTGWTCITSTPVTSFGVPLIEQQWEFTF